MPRRHTEPPVAENRSLRDQFRYAFERRDAAALRALKRYGDEVRRIVNEPTFAFDSPALVAAVGHGDVDLVDALLELGADPNRKSDWWAGGFHPLYSARAEVADRLLAAGAVADACGAAALDRADLLAQMLARNPECVHERGGDGQTPLHFARSRRIADMLLDAGADVNARDVDHRSTAAEWMLTTADDAIAQSRMDVARYLVDRGASVDVFLAAALGLTERVREMLASDPSLLALRTSQGEYAEQAPSSFHVYEWTIGSNLTPLQTASRFGRRDTLAVMMHVASPEQQFMVACQNADDAAARRLMADHPGMVGRLADSDAAAVSQEAWAANAPAVRLMLELGFDPALGPNGETALHRGAWNGSAEIVSAILATPRGRALIESREKTFGGTPLGWCCHGSVNCHRPGADHVAVARLLIAAGVQVPDDMEGSAAVQAVLDGDRPF